MLAGRPSDAPGAAPDGLLARVPTLPCGVERGHDDGGGDCGEEGAAVRFASRSDPNHARLNAMARKVGIRTRTIKLPCDALWLMPNGALKMIEFKADEKARYTDIQAELIAEGWPLVRIEDDDDVMSLLLENRR